MFRLAKDSRPLWALLLFTLLLRGSVLVAMYDKLADDPDAYREIAENILQHGVYGLGKDAEPRPTAYRPPLYPILLTKIALGDTHIQALPVALLHLALGVATVWLTYVVANRLSTIPLVAGLIVACDPILLNQSALVMTETLAAFLTILSLYCLVRFDTARTPFNAGLVGGAIGLAILSRPTYLPWLGLIALVLLLLKVRWPVRLANVAALLGVAAIILAPWTVRNYQVFGKPIATTTHGGYTFYLANNDDFYDYLSQKRAPLPWDSQSIDRSRINDQQDWEDAFYLMWSFPFDEQWINQRRYDAYVRLIEVEMDRQAYEKGRDVIRRRPLDFTYSCLYRLRQLWSPLPHQLTADESLARQLLRYAVAAWYVAVYLLTAVGVYRLRGKLLRTPWVYGLLLCLVFTAAHTFYWSNLRMRAPLMPFVALVACIAFPIAGGQRPPGEPRLDVAWQRSGRPLASG